MRRVGRRPNEAFLQEDGEPAGSSVLRKSALILNTLRIKRDSRTEGPGEGDKDESQPITAHKMYSVSTYNRTGIIRTEQDALFGAKKSHRREAQQTGTATTRFWIGAEVQVEVLPPGRAAVHATLDFGDLK
jgi:hypothetical protein